MLSEYSRRIARLQHALRKKKLDAMIVFDRFNSYYLTGFKSSLSYLMVTPDSARLLIDGRYIESARKAVTHCEVELFKKIKPAIEKWAREFQPRRIGFEGAISWTQQKQFSEWIPNAEFQESGELILKARLIAWRNQIDRREREVE
jgi:Xaa-Pro aminopeptidase